ncbi:uncharacterized protein LOC116604723 isoform X2 [Nematostella vectensis]|uniref:uncharacterized protein LOC116604723 isoform X2 n=1 Tax=Nematostella vectensis TaxID=45351 RepID=UPI0013900844|nr:uncharacterized protein LOC116604723 isoform X2 [Nematostella vectensis]
MSRLVVVVFVLVFALGSALECPTCMKNGANQCSPSKTNCSDDASRCFSIEFKTKKDNITSDAVVKGCVPCKNETALCTFVHDMIKGESEFAQVSIDKCENANATFGNSACPTLKSTAEPTTTAAPTTMGGGSLVASNVMIACAVGFIMCLLKLGY